MTLDEFLGRLRYYAERDKTFKAHVNRAATIRFYEGHQPLYCPITYVCHKHTGVEYPIYLYRKAGMDLGLPNNIADQIVDAADGLNRPDLRARLLYAVGLSTK